MEYLDKLKGPILTKALEKAENPDSILEATDTRPKLGKGTFKEGWDTFTVLEQNPEKKSVFATLKKQGHDLWWMINQSTNDWFLIADKKLYVKEKVAETGTLEEGNLL